MEEQLSLVLLLSSMAAQSRLQLLGRRGSEGGGGGGGGHSNLFSSNMRRVSLRLAPSPAAGETHTSPPPPPAQGALAGPAMRNGHVVNSSIYGNYNTAYNNSSSSFVSEPGLYICHLGSR